MSLAGLGQAGITISDSQHQVHVLTELASVLMVPAVFAAAKASKGKHRDFLRFLGWSMLVVDGALLVNWWLKRRKA